MVPPPPEMVMIPIRNFVDIYTSVQVCDSVSMCTYLYIYISFIYIYYVYVYVSSMHTHDCIYIYILMCVGVYVSVNVNVYVSCGCCVGWNTRRGYHMGWGEGPWRRDTGPYIEICTSMGWCQGKVTVDDSIPSGWWCVSFLNVTSLQRNDGY